MQASQRRPKSPAAAFLARRTRALEAPPWNGSIRTNGQRAVSANSGARRVQASINAALQREPSARSAHSTMVATPAAALVATLPPVGEPQVELMSQLQDVVVRLSQSAVGEKQRLAHMQQRVDAYVALVREQDRMIDELRGMNIKLQKEKDALILFRQQSLSHDIHLMNNMENNGGIDEEVRRAYAKHEGKKASYGASFNDPFGTMTPRSRGFVRSLVAQLRDERRKRLEVEEQSSRMIGEQQLTIQRLEDRLRQQCIAPRGNLFGRIEMSQVSSQQRVPNEERNSVNAPAHPPSNVSFTLPVASTELYVMNRSERTPDAPATAPVVPPISIPDHIREVATPVSAPLPPTYRTDQSSPKVDVPLAIHGTTYEDATAILSDIRKKHGL